jgi:hypothetical protein
MYSGELEVQAKRKALAVLHDEISRILSSARDLAALTNSLLNGDDRDRFAIVKALNEISFNRDLFVLKDALEVIEGMPDKCQEASDSITILALSM